MVGFSSHQFNGMVYCGGSDPNPNNVIWFNPESGEWSELPRPPVKAFALASLSGQVVLVGSFGDDYWSDTRIRVLSSDSSDWVLSYPLPCLLAEHLQLLWATISSIRIGLYDLSRGAVLFYHLSFLSENLPMLCMWLTWRYVCVRKHSVLQPQLL